MKTKIKSTLTSLLKVFFAAMILAWMIQKGLIDFSVFKLFLNPLYIFTGVFLVGAALALGAYRWKLLLDSQGFNLSFWMAYKLTLIGIFFNFAIPGGVGGDLVKGYYLLQDHPERRLQAAMTILMDRIVGLFAMVLMPAAVLLFDLDVLQRSSGLKTVGLVVFGMLIFFVFFFTLAFLPRSKQFIDNQPIFKKIPLYDLIYRLFDAVHSYGKKQIIFWKTVAISLLAQSCSILLIYFVGQAMGLTEVPLKAYFFATTVGFMITAIPISPAGVGVGQAAFYFLFNSYLGYETALGSTSVTVLQSLMLGWGLVGALFYLRWKKINQTLG